MGADSIRAVILENHAAVTEGVTSWGRAADPVIDVIDAGGVLRNVWTGPGGEADVVIFDLGFVSQGQREFRELKELVKKGRKVVVYTEAPKDEVLLRCIDIGALAVVTKDEGRDHLIQAVHRAAEGLEYTGPAHGGAMATNSNPQRPDLPPREVEALLAWFACRTKKPAAEKMGISVKTLDTYILRARVRYEALGRSAPSQSALICRAVEDGIITWDEVRDMHKDS